MDVIISTALVCTMLTAFVARLFGGGTTPALDGLWPGGAQLACHAQ
jgi:hypothetical protein